MLVQIQCDNFAREFKTINFHQGLNTVLGDASGENALGKTTFLWIIDYAFGGDGYCLPDSDIKQYVKDHTIRFIFCLDGEYHYFLRNTSTPKSISRCDKKWHLVENMTLDAYRGFLAESYHANVSIREITNRFFRIYGKNNDFERYPYLSNPREKDNIAVDFLLRLFGKGRVLSAIRAAEDESGIKEEQWIKTKQKPKSFEKIERNEKTIIALCERYSKLMQQDGTSFSLIGLDDESFETVSRLRNELWIMSRRRDELKSRREAVKSSNKTFINTPVAADFAELQEFFPEVNICKLEQIENFHKQLHKILHSEIEDEIARLDRQIDIYDREIARLVGKLGMTGVASDVTQRILSQCVSISKQIDKLKEENSELQQEKEQQELRLIAERRFARLIADRVTATDDIARLINDKLNELNDTVTNGEEKAPKINISEDKQIVFGTQGNTSEGTAFKSMVLYDLALLTLTCIPALIHDGNVLQSISRDEFAKILTIYRACDKQIFIAVDKAENVNLDDTVVLELSEGHTLFGFSWSRKKD